MFSNLVTFFVEDRNCGHYVTLIDRLFFLEVQIAHDTKIVYGSTIHHKIFCNVRNALLKVGESLNFCKFMLSYGFLCHECKEPEVHITKLSKMNSTYLRCYCNQHTRVTPSHKVWFDDVSTITGDVAVSGSKRSLEASYTKQGTAYIYVCLLILIHICQYITLCVSVYVATSYVYQVLTVNN